MTETTGAFLRRRHPLRWRRFRNEMLMMFTLGAYGGFILGMTAQNAYQDILALGAFIDAHLSILWFIAGFALGLNLGGLIALRLKARRARR